VIFSCYFSSNRTTYEFEWSLADLETNVSKYTDKLILGDFNVRFHLCDENPRENILLEWSE